MSPNDEQAIKSCKTLVVNQSSRNGEVSLLAQLVAYDEDQGDLTVKIIGLYNIEFFGINLQVHNGQAQVTGGQKQGEVKFTYNEIKKVTTINSTCIIDIQSS
jgi:hypothetical protein